MSIFACGFLLLLIFTQEFPSIYGRPLNRGKNNEFQNHETHNRDMKIGNSTNGASLIDASPNAPPSPVIGAAQPPPPSHGISDFRPTAPGHSPGVGHSIQN